MTDPFEWTVFMLRGIAVHKAKFSEDTRGQRGFHSEESKRKAAEATKNSPWRNFSFGSKVQ